MTRAARVRPSLAGAGPRPTLRPDRISRRSASIARMSRWLRSMILCLVALALPWQAVAGSALGLCMSHGSAAVARPAVAGHHADEAAPMGHGAYAAHHAAMQSALVTDLDAAASSGDEAGTLFATDAQSCAFCAACAAPAALLPAASPSPASPVPDGGWAAGPAAAIAGIVAPALERPPRLPAA